MPTRPFLVLPRGHCVPLEGPYRIEEIGVQWYVLGYNDALPCTSESAAHARREALLIEHDAHALAAEALAGLPAEYRVVAQRS